jgi:hypothetical protein
MSATIEPIESRVTGRYAARLANRIQNSTGMSVAQVISWLDLVDLCRELDDALLEQSDNHSASLALHKAIVSLAIGTGTWLLHQADLNEVDLRASGQRRDSIKASLELLHIFYRTRHAEFPAVEVEAVRQRIFNAAA